MKAEVRVFKYGDNVDTDVIIPARYLNSSDPAELATHCMEDIDKDFVKKVQKGDIIVANKNFGCGLSRADSTVAVLLQKPLQEFSTAIPSISVFRLSNVRKLQRQLKPVMRWKWILTAA